MNYIAVLDHDHLDNNLFLKAFADAISRQRNVKGIILHGDSAYTDRIIQTGVMREDARFRSTRELNTRLIALLADSGVPAIGVNGYQKEIISYDSDTDQLTIKKSFFDSIPGQTFLVLSNLIHIKNSKSPQAFPLTKLAVSLQSELDFEELFAFKKSEEDEVMIKNDLPERLNWNDLDENFKNEHVPNDLTDLNKTFNLVTSRSFMKVPDNSKVTKIIFEP